MEKKIDNMKNESKWYICPNCGHEVLADNKPAPIKWSDGHTCYFIENKIQIYKNI